MLLHSGAEPSFINRTIVLTHLQAADLDKARWIVRVRLCPAYLYGIECMLLQTERMTQVNAEECVKTATNWCKQNNIDGIVGLLIIGHEQNWSMEHCGTDIKQLFFHYIIRSSKLYKKKQYTDFKFIRINFYTILFFLKSGTFAL